MRRSGKVFRTQSMPIFRCSLRHPQRKRRTTASRFRVDDKLHVPNLVGALHLRMRSKYLLDQSRAGAWETDDEDDLLAKPGIQGLRQCLSERSCDCLHASLLPSGTALHPLPLRRLDITEYLEGMHVIALDFQCLGQSGAKQLSIFSRSIFAPECALQTCCVGGIELKCIEVRQAEPRFRVIGITTQYFTESRHGSFNPAQAHLCTSQ